MIQSHALTVLYTVLIGRYAYTLSHEQDGYSVTCQDTITNHVLRHGPLSEQEAHAMIDARIAREETLKRD